MYLMLDLHRLALPTLSAQISAQFADFFLISADMSCRSAARTTRAILCAMGRLDARGGRGDLRAGPARKVLAVTQGRAWARTSTEASRSPRCTPGRRCRRT